MLYLGFWVLATYKKNLVALSQKLWIFLWCLTFASYYPAQKTELWLAKVRHKKKIHNFWDRVTKFFLQVGNTQKPKHTKFGGQIMPFIAGKIHFCVRGSILFLSPCTFKNIPIINTRGKAAFGGFFSNFLIQGRRNWVRRVCKCAPNFWPL